MENFATLVEYKDGSFQWLPRYYGNCKKLPNKIRAFVAYTHKDRVTDWRRWRYDATLTERIFVE